MKVVIKGELTDLNTYINAERTNRHKAAKIKKQETYRVAAAFMPHRLDQPKLPIYLTISWYCKNKRKDPDNVCFAKKFIMDGMQKAGFLENDGFKQIKGFKDDFEVDKKNPRIEIEIKESQS